LNEKSIREMVGEIKAEEAKNGGPNVLRKKRREEKEKERKTLANRVLPSGI